MTEMTREMAEEISDKETLEGVHPEDRDSVRKNLEQCLSGKTDTFELRYRIKKGTTGYVWVSSKYSLIQNEGKDDYIFINYYDITEEKNSRRDCASSTENRFCSTIF